MTTSAALEQKGRVSRPGRRFLAAFLGSIAVIAAFVAIINQITFRILTQPENRQVAQLVSGWDRTYKPLLYDAAKPQIAAFGASWVRDAFDPELIHELTGKSFFNFGVSGGTSYEAWRFLDSAIASSPPESVLLNLDSFFDTAEATRTHFGFNEKLLHTTEDGEANLLAPIYRAYALNFSGASIGYNFRVLETMFDIDRGKQPEEVLEAYERLDFGNWRPAIAALRKRILDEGEEEADATASFPRQRRSGSGGLTTLTRSVEALCARDIDVHAYFTPHHMLHYGCTQDVESEMAILATLKQAAAQCPSKISYHVFAYPNAVTLEGVADETGQSKFYRPDGHPRPITGQLMAARMLDEPFPEGTIPRDADFGADLMTMPAKDARAWLEDRKARCTGEWRGDALDELRAQMAPGSG